MSTPRNERLLLMIAIACGIGATATAFIFLKSLDEAKAVPSARRVKILTAARDLPSNRILTREDVGELEVSEDLQSLYRLSFKESERAAVIGRRLGPAVAAGAPLLYSHFASLEDMVIEEGYRAVGINVSAANAAGGLLVPGDLVDVVVTRPKANQPNVPASGGGESPEQQMLTALIGQMSQAREWESELVLPSVKILAVGSHLHWSRKQLQQTKPTLPGDTGSSAFTLQVKPDDAIMLLEKTGAGSLKVSLLLCPKQGATTLAGAAVP